MAPPALWVLVWTLVQLGLEHVHKLQHALVDWVELLLHLRRLQDVVDQGGYFNLLDLDDHLTDKDSLVAETDTAALRVALLVALLAALLDPRALAMSNGMVLSLNVENGMF